MYSTGIAIFLSTLTATVYCDCGKAAWGAFRTCMSEEFQTKKECFTKAKCQTPPLPSGNGGSAGASGQGYENFGRGENGPNLASLKECAEKTMAKGKADLETCVQRSEPTFALPPFDFLGGEHQQQWKSQGHEVGHFGPPPPPPSGRGGSARGGSSSGLGSSQFGCNRTTLQTCLSGLIGDGASGREERDKEMCSVTKGCLQKAFTGCDVNKTHDAVCSCAKSTLRPNFDQYVAELKTCAGPKNEKLIDRFVGAKQKEQMLAQIEGAMCKAWNADDVCKPPQFNAAGGSSGLPKGRGKQQAR